MKQNLSKCTKCPEPEPNSGPILSIRYDDDGSYQLYCFDCGTSTKFATSLAGAINSWNRLNKSEEIATRQRELNEKFTREQLTIQEKVALLLQQRCEELDDDGHTFEYFESRYTEYRNARRIEIRISDMYSLGGFVSFEFLSRLADLLGTRKLDLEDEDYERGCDTCDYGSTHSVTLVCRDVPLDTWNDSEDTDLCKSQTNSS